MDFMACTVSMFTLQVYVEPVIVGCGQLLLTLLGTMWRMYGVSNIWTRIWSKASFSQGNETYTFVWGCCQSLGSFCTNAKQKYRDRVMEEIERVALFLYQAKEEHSRLVPQELCPPPCCIGEATQSGSNPCQEGSSLLLHRSGS